MFVNIIIQICNVNIGFFSLKKMTEDRLTRKTLRNICYTRTCQIVMFLMMAITMNYNYLMQTLKKIQKLKNEKDKNEVKI